MYGARYHRHALDETLIDVHQPEEVPELRPSRWDFNPVKGLGVGFVQFPSPTLDYMAEVFYIGGEDLTLGNLEVNPSFS